MKSLRLSNPVNNQDLSFHFVKGDNRIPQKEGTVGKMRPLLNLLEGWIEQHKTWEILFPHTSFF